MNLLIKRLGLFASLLTILFACEEPQDIGKDLQPQNQSFGVLFTDTVTVLSSTVLVDSVRTSISNYMLAGKYEDAKLGTVTAKSFFQARLADSTFVLAESPAYDSLVLFLDMEYSYGDTNQIQQLSVHQLSESVQAKPYYNSDSLAYDKMPLGRKEFKASPRNDTLAIKLSDDLGADLLNLNGQTLESFLNLFYGLALVPGTTDNAAILGFSIGAGSKLRLYYRSGASQTKNFYDFPLNARGFNYIHSDRSNTTIAGLQRVYDELPAALTAEETFIQAGTGIMTKVEIPYIQKLKELGNVAINRAELVLEPVSSSVSTSNPVPAGLALYQPTTSGSIVKSAEGYLIPLSSGYTNNPQFVGYDSSKKSYTFTLSSNIQGMLEGRENNSFYVSVPSVTLNNIYGQTYVSLPESLENTVNRLAVGSSQNTTNRLKLNIYYTLVR